MAENIISALKNPKEAILFEPPRLSLQDSAPGDLSPGDIRATERALEHGLWLLSGFVLPDGTWHLRVVITEADRSATTMLSPMTA